MAPPARTQHRRIESKRLVPSKRAPAEASAAPQGKEPLRNQKKQQAVNKVYYRRDIKDRLRGLHFGLSHSRFLPLTLKIAHSALEDRFGAAISYKRLEAAAPGKRDAKPPAPDKKKPRHGGRRG